MPFGRVRRRFRRQFRRRFNRGNHILGQGGYTGVGRLWHPSRFGKGKNRRLRRIAKAVMDLNKLKSNYQVVNTYRVVPTAANKQVFQTVMIEASGLDLSNIKAQIAAYDAGVTIPQSFRYWLDACQCQLIIKNQSQQNVFADLYSFVPRYDTGNFDPVSILQNGFIAGGNSGGELLIGATPFQSNTFCTTYKIVKITPLTLAPGAVERISLVNKRQKKIEYERLFYQTGSVQNSQQFKGISMNHMLRMYSEPINDSTTKTNIGFVNAALDVVSIETYYYSWNVDDVVKCASVSTLGAISTASTTLEQTGAANLNPTNS